MKIQNADTADITDQIAMDYARVAPSGLPGIIRDHPDAYERIRSAGAVLHARGGVSAMRDAIVSVHDLTDGIFPTGSDFNGLWDGIGIWRA